MEEDKQVILKFVPPKSFVHSDFWYKLADIKLNIDKLNDSPKTLYAFINKSEKSRLLIEIDCTAFNSVSSASGFSCRGILLNKNTVEEFKSIDKDALIRKMSCQYYKNIFLKDRLNHSSDLIFFILLSFADFKTHKYYYWFAFPVLRPLIYTCVSQTLLSSIFDNERCLNFDRELQRFNSTNPEPLFVYNSTSNCFSRLRDLVNHADKTNNFKDTDLDSTYFCCVDQSYENNASWILRQYLGYLAISCPKLLNRIVKCICIRETISSSFVYQIMLPSECDLESSWIGWEVNEHGKYTPRLADMSKTMDPLVLADRTVSLNLTLMKWRILPDLDLDIIRKTKYLLLGAGTLGCGVARSLLAWGALHITFVDYGKVSLSNPVRQTLFLYEDAVNGGKLKAVTAAERLRQIHPCVVSSGYSIKIPMPGHSVAEAQLDETTETINTLNDLVMQHDVVFLLTDSRESRWLPSMLSTYHGKMTINAALGFDSFLVMRHGSKSTVVESTCDIRGFKELHGSRLGCYFCNDVVAPGNSLKDRTLDQQCTVTRPAVSNIASSLAVEMAVSLLQHGDRHSAPAYYRTSNIVDDLENIPEGLLGIIPHSIRGNIYDFKYLITATERFSECVACSSHILDMFEQQGNPFVLDVINSSKILEDITGISQLQEGVDEVIDFDSDND
ncbi:uncharacterized protein LOC129770892 isoform X2 [Toxorhynchites rutilus septentrionalis]|uniref:uncharacterized protein LOC129770892 isoform X2 n=1 Tax=Toxorhynchites rutilus septentrionalis TaxID=329112 RepID=UPI002478FF95|nr:uncharacterized protein LOC129770892 isoform X2 [Toxorhynchites rutilus septentrionalis]